MIRISSSPRRREKIFSQIGAGKHAASRRRLTEPVFSRGIARHEQGANPTNQWLAELVTLSATGDADYTRAIV